MEDKKLITEMLEEDEIKFDDYNPDDVPEDDTEDYEDHILRSHEEFKPDDTENENLNEDYDDEYYSYDDPDYWSDKLGPTYLISYKGEPKFYVQYPYAGDPHRGGNTPSKEEILKAALGYLEGMFEDEDIDEAQISFEVEEDPYNSKYDLEVYDVDYNFEEENIADEPFNQPLGDEE